MMMMTAVIEVDSIVTAALFIEVIASVVITERYSNLLIATASLSWVIICNSYNIILLGIHNVIVEASY